MTHTTMHGVVINMPAVRAWRRVYAPIQAEWDDACAAAFGLCPDGYGYDKVAGYYQDWIDRAQAQVAARFGLSPQELDRQDNESFWLEEKVLFDKGLL